MKRIIWEKKGRIIFPEEGPDWRRHISGAVHVMPFENGRYRVYLTGVGEDIPPMVIREEDGYRMWFSLRTPEWPYCIGYAESPDGLNWERKAPGVDPSADGWDSKQVEYAYVLKEEDRYLMFYNGDGYGATGTGLAIGTLG